jgi:hypothetical protein
MMGNVVTLPELRLKLKGPMRLHLKERSEVAGNFYQFVGSRPRLE